MLHKARCQHRGCHNRARSTVLSRICLVGRQSNRTNLRKIELTGQFCFFGVSLTGQLENFGKLTVSFMFTKSHQQENFEFFFGGQENFELFFKAGRTILF